VEYETIEAAEKAVSISLYVCILSLGLYIWIVCLVCGANADLGGNVK